MTLNDLLLKIGIRPSDVVVMRHRPKEQGLRKVLHWLAADRPEVFNAYQQAHSARVQDSLARLCGKGFLASFIGLSAGEAVFAGLYEIKGAKAVSFGQFWGIAANLELRRLGMSGWNEEDAVEEMLWFDLAQLPFYESWRGKLIVSWPPPERSWFRRAERNEMNILSIREESLFVQSMPDWRELVLSWAELQVIPSSWKASLGQWRGIYLIHDASDGRNYVGSAYGRDNILGRWLNYAASGHGDNKLLKARSPENFHFSILQRVSPDMEPTEIIRLEAGWKNRLHSRKSFGLNGN